jgi:hypothetical protein
MASPQDAPAAEVPIRGKKEKILWNRKVGKKRGVARIVARHPREKGTPFFFDKI